MNESKLPPPRAKSERQLACVSCGAVKGEGKCSNGCVFPEPSKGEQGQPPSTVQVTFCGKCGQTGLHNTRCSKCGNRLMFSDEITYARIRSGVTQQSVESVWRQKEYERVVQAIRDMKLNYVPVNSVLEAIAPPKNRGKSLAAQNKDQEKS